MNTGDAGGESERGDRGSLSAIGRLAPADGAARLARRLVPAPVRSFVKSRRAGADYIPPPGWVSFGSLRRLRPLSNRWGRDRGQAIDRFYIEAFLEQHREHIRGRVLEVGDATYTVRYGGSRVERSDVLHIDPASPHATIVADLANADHLEDDQFDCIILTQTLQMIFDVQAALRTVRRILKPGGVLLCTIPGITHTNDRDWHDTWYWSFTPLATRRFFDETFGANRSRVESHGNVLVATAFLYGLAREELTPTELAVSDPAFAVTITVFATKPARN